MSAAQTPTAPPVLVPGTALSRPISPFVQTIAAVLLTVFVLVVYDRYFRAPADSYTLPIVAAAKQYRATLPDAYTGAAQAIKAGKIKSKKELVELLKEHAKPLADAEDEAINQVIDKESGNITNPLAAADLLERVGKALR